MFAYPTTLLAAGLTILFAGSAQAETPLDIRPHESAAVCKSAPGQIEVTVNGVTAEGILTVELYEPSKRDFLKKASRVHRIRVPAENGPQTVCFAPQPAGKYAIAVYQDEDADRDLDQQWNGMPKEPFGLSTNPKLKLGFPKFESADFELPDVGTNITIDLVR